MSAFAKIVENFLSFKRVPMKVVVITALTSYVLQLGMILQNQPLYIIALYTLLPWIPILLFESIWKIEHYHWIAIFGVITALQVGHLAEHLTQVGALAVVDGTLACPPPVDTDVFAQRAIDAGLRDPEVGPTGLSSSIIIAPAPDGTAKMNADGTPISGPPACGIFGQLDLEIVHLIWDILGWVLTLMLLRHFPHSKWLWLAVFWSSVHTVEHLFISYTFFFDPEMVYQGAHQIWATIADGSIVTAYPLGKEAAIVNFYEVAGKFGIAAKNGLLGTFIPGLNDVLPTRPWLHFFYNSLITIPTVIAFVLELRKLYDSYLAEALPRLSKNQLVQATPKLEPMHFKAGEVIIKQGDIADSFYIISKGEVEVVHEEPDGSEHHLANLHHGQYFGEIGILHGSERIATVRAIDNVEVMKLDRHTFLGLVDNSELTHQDVEQVMRQREAEVAAS